MKKNDMFGNVDPYDLIIQMNDRLNQLELAHNQLARDYMKTQQEFGALLTSHQHLQKSHLALSQLVSLSAMAKFDITESELQGKI